MTCGRRRRTIGSRRRSTVSDCRHLVVHEDDGIPGLEWLGFVPKRSTSCDVGLMERDGADPWRPCEGCPGFESKDVNDCRTAV